jgi:hypothetical protein
MDPQHCLQGKKNVVSEFYDEIIFQVPYSAVVRLLGLLRSGGFEGAA